MSSGVPGPDIGVGLVMVRRRPKVESLFILFLNLFGDFSFFSVSRDAMMERWERKEGVVALEALVINVLLSKCSTELRELGTVDSDVRLDARVGVVGSLALRSGFGIESGRDSFLPLFGIIPRLTAFE
jgi:hypothetical protein